MDLYSVSLGRKEIGTFHLGTCLFIRKINSCYKGKTYQANARIGQFGCSLEKVCFWSQRNNEDYASSKCLCLCNFSLIGCILQPLKRKSFCSSRTPSVENGLWGFVFRFFKNDGLSLKKTKSSPEPVELVRGVPLLRKHIIWCMVYSYSYTAIQCIEMLER